MDAKTQRRIDGRLQELYERHREADAGAVASYYRSGEGYRGAEDAGADQDVFGVCLVGMDGDVHRSGDCEIPFALQSISKVVAYALALDAHGPEAVLRRVGVEPSGDAFNSLEFDERHHRPFNPMVNAGALVTTDMVPGAGPGEKIARILDAVRRWSGNDAVAVNEAKFAAELGTADRNRATAYLMRSNGMLAGDVEELLALYLRQCSIAVTCRDLAVMSATLANGGINPVTGCEAVPRRRLRDLLSVMYTCGMYDFAGEWSYSVGVPAKSGVSGGVLAVVPKKMGIGVYSPGLDEYGNSVRGIRVCQEISARLGLHVFASDAEDSLLGPAPPH